MNNINILKQNNKKQKNKTKEANTIIGVINSISFDIILFYFHILINITFTFVFEM